MMEIRTVTHCGDGFCLRVQDHYFPARMELDTHWYVLIEDDKFRLHPNQIYDAFLFNSIEHNKSRLMELIVFSGEEICTDIGAVHPLRGVTRLTPHGNIGD